MLERLPLDIKNKIITYGITEYPCLKELQHTVTRYIYIKIQDSFHVLGDELLYEEYNDVWYSLPVENRQKLLKFDMRREIDLCRLEGFQYNWEEPSCIFVLDTVDFFISAMQKKRNFKNIEFSTQDGKEFIHINSRAYRIIIVN